MAAQQQPSAETEETEAKPDVKPRRLATSYLGLPRTAVDDWVQR